VLVNKTDLASGDRVASTEDAIRRVNPSAVIHRTVNAGVDLARILNIQAYSARPADAQVDRAPGHAHHDHDAHGDCDCATHFEMRGISSLSVSCPPLDDDRLSRLDEWIRTVLWENHIPGEHTTAGLEVLRSKGMFSAGGKHHILQGVRNIYEIVPVGEGPPFTGKLVLIGKNLHETEVKASLMRVLWE
jgi:G3E family GTPase